MVMVAVMGRWKSEIPGDNQDHPSSLDTSKNGVTYQQPDAWQGLMADNQHLSVTFHDG